MAGFFKRLFGGKKSEANSEVESLISSTMEGIIAHSGLDLSYNLSKSQEAGGDEIVLVNIEGADDELLQDNKGELLRAFQLLLQRVVQHNFPEDRTKIDVDNNDYLKEASESLIEIVEDLKEKAIRNGKSVYLRALPPKERKIVHQYLASDSRVRGRSIGDGLYKKIKIYPVKNSNKEGKEETVN